MKGNISFILYLLHFVVIYLIFVKVAGAQECSASQYCCMDDPSEEDKTWQGPAGTPDAFANCYIQGGDIKETDCPEGWEFEPEHNYCHTGGSAVFKPFTPTNTFNTIPACVDHAECDSVEDRCGNPTIRSGLSLSVNCIIQGGPPLERCPASWHKELSNICVKSMTAGDHEKNNFKCDWPDDHPCKICTDPEHNCKCPQDKIDKGYCDGDGCYTTSKNQCEKDEDIWCEECDNHEDRELIYIVLSLVIACLCSIISCFSCYCLYDHFQKKEKAKNVVQRQQQQSIQQFNQLQNNVPMQCIVQEEPRPQNTTTVSTNMVQIQTAVAVNINNGNEKQRQSILEQMWEEAEEAKKKRGGW